MSEAKFAPVAPLESLVEMHQQGLRLPYLLLLAHDVAERPAEWRDAIHDMFADSFIIMDNSLVELGHPCSREAMQIACKAAHPDIIVLPDKLEDAAETFRMTKKGLRDWGDIVEDAHFLAVVQGHTKDTVRDMVRRLKALPGVDHLSIPRVIAQQFGSRDWAVSAATAICGTLIPKIHLLGFSDDIRDDLQCARAPGVMGIDSAVPIRAGIKGIYGENMLHEDPGPRGDYWEEARYKTDSFCVGNVEWVQDQLKG